MGTKLYTYLDEEGRILSVTNADFHDGAVEYEYPDDFDVMSIGDYRIVDGALEYTGEATAAREEAEREAQAEAERKQAIDEGCQAFFLDGGKTEMEKAIEDAAASGGGADPQVAVMARLLAPSIDFATVTATDVVAIPERNNLFLANKEMFDHRFNIKVLDSTKAVGLDRAAKTVSVLAVNQPHAKVTTISYDKLVIATGAGSGSRRAIGITTFSGMVVATLVGIIFTPALYAAFQRIREQIKGKLHLSPSAQSQEDAE